MSWSNFIFIHRLQYYLQKILFSKIHMYMWLKVIHSLFLSLIAAKISNFKHVQ